MAITKLNSLAIPAGTVEPADISYPLTNFSSTGIDDNATNKILTLSGSSTTNNSLVTELGSSSTSGYYIGSNSDGLEAYLHPLSQVGTTIRLKSNGNIILSHNEVEDGIYLRTNDTNRLFIKSNGQVGIGTASPNAILHVYNDVDAQEQIIIAETFGDYSDGTGISFVLDQTEMGHVNAHKTRGMTFYVTPGSEAAAIERMRIDTDGNLGINETTPSGLTGNTSGVGTSSKFKVTGSVGSTQIANTGNLIAFSRDAANYISATGSSASLIYDSPTHYLRAGSEDYLVLGTNATTGNKFARTQEIEYEDSTVRESARYVGVSSYWTSGEYVEICEVDPSGNSQNYTINAKLWATNGQVGENLDIEFRVRSNTLPAIVHYCVYEKTRAGTSFGLQPKVWYDSTNGVIKLVVKNTSANIHCADFKVTVQSRAQSYSRDNVTIGTGAEITTGVPSGYSESSALEVKNTYYNDTVQYERKPALPAMSAYNTGIGSWTSVNSGTTETIQFNSTNYNQASVFNTGNGRFTVIASGIYAISGHVYGKLNAPSTSSDYWGVLLYVNGSTSNAPWYALEGYYNSGDYDKVISFSQQLFLNANDYVEIKFRATNAAASYYRDNCRFQAAQIG